MNRPVVLVLFILTSLLFSSITFLPVHSEFSRQTIYIKADGSITPASAPIQRNGDIFTLTGDVTSQLIVERDSSFLDGKGHALRGGGSGVGLNMTCSNVTVSEMEITHWDAGVLGVFDNNTIKDCSVLYCNSGFKIYAPYYLIINNNIEQNAEGLRLADTLNFVAGNTIVNNVVGFHIFSSANVIVQNEVANSSQNFLIFDTGIFNETVYHNNFINNQGVRLENVYNNGQSSASTLLAWDNGSSGNYWSSYNGADANGDGIGDTPYHLPGPTNLIDRYPLIAPFNTKNALPQVPAVLIPPPITQIISNSNSNRQKALSFIENVLKLDLNSYKTISNSDTLGTGDTGSLTEHFSYTLDSTKAIAYIDNEFSNNTLISCRVNSYYNKMLTGYPITNSYGTAKKFIQTYQTWTNDTEVTQMVNLLSEASSQKNVTKVSGNIDLIILVTPYSSSYNWSYTFNGADYSGVSLILENGGLVFSDNRAIYSIGNTTIAFPQQQAIQIAQNYVRNFSYTIKSGLNVTTVHNLNPNATGTTADLLTATRSKSTLSPYWNIRVPLDHTYYGYIGSVTVNIWADNGEVFSAQQNTIALPPPQPYVAPIVLTMTIATAAIIVTALLLIFLYKSEASHRQKEATDLT